MSDRKAFPLRLSPDLYEEIRRWADADLRSVNGQIEFILRQAVARRRGQGSAPPSAPPAGAPGAPPAEPFDQD